MKIPVKINVILILFLLLVLGWMLWDKFVNLSWVDYHYPADGAMNVPLHDTITIQWSLERVSDIGMKIEYLDDPSIPIHGVTSGSKDGMVFMPEGFLPDKQVKVTASAGWRSYTFSFTTAHEADQGIDLYKAVFHTFFKAPQQEEWYEWIALDTSSLPDLNEDEKKQLAEGLLAYVPNVLYGSSEKGFVPVHEMVGGPVLDDKEILLLRLKKVKEEFGTFEMELTGNKGKGNLEGKEGEVFHRTYSTVYRNGKWEVEEQSIGK